MCVRVCVRVCVCVYTHKLIENKIVTPVRMVVDFKMVHRF